MNLYIFNPEHDIAFASNLENFTAPHAGRQLRHDLGFLPALWADADDYVLVDDKDSAVEGLRRLGLPIEAKLIEPTELTSLLRQEPSLRLNINPWGWDAALRHYLIGLGVAIDDVPSNAWINKTRVISHRAWAANNILKPLRNIQGTIGESCELKDIKDVRTFLSEHHNIVLKAPWSSSGRGVRYLSDNQEIAPQEIGWTRNVLLRQGSIMAEPYYNKVCDFGMEFSSDGKGRIAYRGLSVFHTTNGAYTGNLLEDEPHKEAMICRYIDQSTLKNIATKIQTIMSSAIGSLYKGPFGVDMMVVRVGEELHVHPCVELNLRMTMGHAALLLASKYHLEEQTMRISYTDGRYRLRLTPIVNQH